jgi:hypothetical protein
LAIAIDCGAGQTQRQHLYSSCHNTGCLPLLIDIDFDLGMVPALPNAMIKEKRAQSGERDGS